MNLLCWIEPKTFFDCIFKDAKEGEITSVPIPKTSAAKGSSGASDGAGDAATKSTSRKGKSTAAKGSAGSKVKQEEGDSPEKSKTS